MNDDGGSRRLRTARALAAGLAGFLRQWVRERVGRLRGRGEPEPVGFDAQASVAAREKPGAGDVSTDPRYAVRPEGATLRRFTARADQPRITQALLDAARMLPGELGLVVVEVHDRPREWTATAVERASVLEMLVGMRDLLGRGGLDVAVFSPDEGVEVFLDRFATLEIRCGEWNEPRFRGMLEGLGFSFDERVPSLPETYPDPVAWTEEDRSRVEELCAAVGLSAPPATSETQGAR